MIKTLGTPVEQAQTKFHPASLEGGQIKYKNIRLCAGRGYWGCWETTILALAGMKEEVVKIGRAKLPIGQEAKGKFREWKKTLIAIVQMICPMREHAELYRADYCLDHEL